MNNHLHPPIFPNTEPARTDAVRGWAVALVLSYGLVDQSIDQALASARAVVEFVLAGPVDPSLSTAEVTGEAAPPQEASAPPLEAEVAHRPGVERPSPEASANVATVPRDGFDAAKQGYALHDNPYDDSTNEPAALAWADAWWLGNRSIGCVKADMPPPETAPASKTEGRSAVQRTLDAIAQLLIGDTTAASNQQIADAADVPVANVSANLVHLRKRGWIEVLKSPDGRLIRILAGAAVSDPSLLPASIRRPTARPAEKVLELPPLAPKQMPRIASRQTKEQSEVARFVAEKGVRRFEPGTSETLVVSTLRSAGIEAARTSKGLWTLDGKGRWAWSHVVAKANEIRLSRGQQPISLNRAA